MIHFVDLANKKKNYEFYFVYVKIDTHRKTMEPAIEMMLSLNENRANSKMKMKKKMGKKNSGKK